MVVSGAARVALVVVVPASRAAALFGAVAAREPYRVVRARLRVRSVEYVGGSVIDAPAVGFVVGVAEVR